MLPHHWYFLIMWTFVLRWNVRIAQVQCDGAPLQAPAGYHFLLWISLKKLQWSGFASLWCGSWSDFSLRFGWFDFGMLIRIRFFYADLDFHESVSVRICDSGLQSLHGCTMSRNGSFVSLYTAIDAGWASGAMLQIPIRIMRIRNRL